MRFRLLSLTFVLAACLSPQGVGLSSPHAAFAQRHAGRRFTAKVEIDSLLAASDSHLLVEGSVNTPPFGTGLYWVDVASGQVTRAFPPADATHMPGRVFSRSTHEAGLDLVVDESRVSDREMGRPRHVLAVDPSRRIVVPVMRVGPWTATTSRGDDRFIASNGWVFTVPKSSNQAEPTLAGAWVTNQTSWMTWVGPVLVSVDGGRVTTCQDGADPRFPDLSLRHPARWEDDIVGYSRGELIAWSPDASLRGRTRVLVKDLGLRYGELVAPVVTSKDGLFALTTGDWVLWINPVSGAIRGRARSGKRELGTDEPWLLPTMVGDGRGVWVAHQLKYCRNLGSLGFAGEQPSLPEPCQPKSELEYLSLQDFAVNGSSVSGVAF